MIFYLYFIFLKSQTNRCLYKKSSDFDLYAKGLKSFRHCRDHRCHVHIRDRIKGSRNEEKKEEFQTMGQVSKGSNEIPWHVTSVNSSIDQIQIPHSLRNYPVKEVLYAG